MNYDKNLYVVFYTEDSLYPEHAKVVKVFTDPEKTKKYLLTKNTVNGKKVVKDNKWILKVYSYVGSNDCYEYSKWETGQLKNDVGVCAHCHQYFLRENNSNMCENCLTQVKQGLKECEVCHKFFSPNETKFVSNGDVFPSLACTECSKPLLQKLKLNG